MNKYDWCSNRKPIDNVDIALDEKHPDKKYYCRIFHVVAFSDCHNCPHYNADYIVQFNGMKKLPREIFEMSGYKVITEEEWQRDKDIFEKWEDSSDKARRKQNEQEKT